MDKIDRDFNSIKEILKKSKFKLEDSSFEEDVMAKIVSEKDYRVRVRGLIKKSFICFTGGIILCISLILWFLFIYDSVNTSYHSISIIILFTLSIIGTLFADNFFNLLYNYKPLNQTLKTGT